MYLLYIRPLYSSHTDQARSPSGEFYFVIISGLSQIRQTHATYHRVSTPLSLSGDLMVRVSTYCGYAVSCLQTGNYAIIYDLSPRPNVSFSSHCPASTF